MIGELVNSKIQAEVDEDVYVAALEKERAWIEKRQMAIYIQEDGNMPELHSDAGAEWKALNTRLDFINEQLRQPSEETLWTADDVAASVVEEDLAKAHRRLHSADVQYLEACDYCRQNPGSPYGEKQANRWLQILWARQEEVYRLENLLIDNPASGWLPF